MKLNEHQKKAVEHFTGPLLVIAGAGSGKTRVVTQRIIQLMQKGVPSSSILALTFTNKAAHEMKERIRRETEENIYASTFHSFGAKFLRETIALLGYKNDFLIYDEDDSLRIVKECSPDLKDSALKNMRLKIAEAKNSLSPLSDKLFLNYVAKLKECNAVDFEDLLLLPITLLKENESVRTLYQNRYRFILIDEYQDTNLAQHTLIKLLANSEQNIFAVGDPDQSIYSWRGARYQNILNFQEDFKGAEVISLEENYRSTNAILSAANSLIEHNNRRFEKRLFSSLGEGERPKIFIADTEKEEAKFIISTLLKHSSSIPLKDAAIFYRTNAQSRIFEDLLLENGLPYVIYGALSFYQRKEIKDLISLLRLVHSKTDLVSFQRMINTPKRGVGASSVEKIKTFAEEKGVSILDAALEAPLPPKQRESIREFIDIINDAKGIKSLPDIISRLIVKTGYLTNLEEDELTFSDRKENIDEFILKAAEWEASRLNPTLTAFLEELSLVSSRDEDNSNSLKLMTLHNSKGLEFSLVFVAGVEEDLLPHINSKESGALEEERRLLYVGMTRAKQVLYLTAARVRPIWGEMRLALPSRFLKEISNTQNLSPYNLPQEEEVIEKGEFKPGAKVDHFLFGRGIIQKVYNSSFGETCDILFEGEKANRSLATKFAKLKLIKPSDKVVF